MYYVYILKSKADNTYYVGQTKNLDKRINRHNSGGSIYTKLRKPWAMVYFEEYSDSASAKRREREIKSWKSRKLIEEMIQHSD
jgi:putative endonuclease